VSRINSRAKGKTGELELAAFLRERGYEARRGQQFHGGADSPDVIGLPGVHVECKRVEAGNLYAWLDQAIGDAGANTPIVCHRRSRREWVAILRLDDFLTLFKRALPPAPSRGEAEPDFSESRAA
jgi:hypothetical protein